MSKRCGRGCKDLQQALLGCSKSSKKHWSVVQKWMLPFWEEKKVTDVLHGMQGPRKAGFVTGRSVETKRTVMRNTKKWHAAKHAHSDEKSSTGLLAKKSRPKSMECCSKMALGWFWWKLKSPNGEDVLDGTQQQQKAGFGDLGFVEAKRPSC